MSSTMHFGPEWMRTKSQPSSRPQPPSPPPTATPITGASTYSALVSPAPPTQPEKRDEAHPFRYSKEEMLRIYKEGGGKGGLGIEVERWEGVVREVGTDPIGLREMDDSEKKLFAGPLNSDLRRRQSTDYLSPLSTQALGSGSRLNLSNTTSGTSSPLRERFGVLRRRDSTDQSPAPIPRKQSLSSLQQPLMTPRDAAVPSPRNRVGFTPNFDGVLNGGDSWVARRRASETSLRSGVGTSRDQGDQIDSKASEIREEEEDGGRHLQAPEHVQEKQDVSRPHATSTTAPSQCNNTTSLPDGQIDMAHPSIGANGSIVPEPVDNLTNGPPPGLLDLASVEWSYKDPSGQVQGPFRADLMQKWYDEGYFTPDLPMKRTHLDTHWVTVEEIVQRTPGGKIFLTHRTPTLPPGLSLRTESPHFGDHLFNGPYQPAPLRTLRSSTLDAYASPSDSPSSSFGGGRFGNGSPDLNAFGGRGAYFVGDTSHGSRVASFSSAPDPSAAFSVRRNTFNDSSLDPSLTTQSPGFGNVILNRGSAGDSYGYNLAYSPGPNTWGVMPNTPGTTFDTNTGHTSAVDPVPYSNFGPNASVASTSYGNLQDSSQNNVFGEGAAYQTLNHNQYNALGGGHGPTLRQQYTNSPTTQHVSPHIPQQLASSSSNAHEQQGNTQQAMPNDPQSVDQLSSTTSAQSLWDNEAYATRRPSPFEVAHPTSTNTMVVQPPAAVDKSPWGRGSQSSRPGSHVNDISPWAVTSQGAVEDNWKEAPGTDRLTFSNVGKHNEHQHEAAATTNRIGDVEEAQDQTQPLSEPPALPAASSDTTMKALGILPVHSQPQMSAKAAQPPVPKVAPPTSRVTPDTSPSVDPKPAWLKEDEVIKTKSSGVSVSLREIQEAEGKKAEARKATEREKERAARASALTAEVKGESQPFTASWGLPTSQAGVRNSAPSAKDTKDATPSPSSATPVWTTSGKSPVSKKSMKEIQEEEERRKKTAAKETVAAAAARRAYAESTTKITPTPPPQGSAWTVVGANGKSSTPAVAVSRPTTTPSSSTSGAPGSAPRVNGNTVRTVLMTPSAKPPPVSSQPDDLVSPSHDFLKWLNDSLKGLNNAVNVEEIMSMLLSFPMDPDTSTVELISELIYANSTTLDGRRFAAEFISKRKADAAARSKKSAGKVVSIADVVKATPKPQPQEWGFKVVNKKKKGGRA